MENLHKEQLYDLIIGELPVALFVVDEQLRIIEFNAAAEAITGWKRSEVIGHPCAEILSSTLCKDQCPMRESVETGRSCLSREALIQSREGSAITIFLSSVAQVSDDGRFLYGIEVFRDGTASKKLEAQKKNLISLFTHDLKAPVTIAGGFVERLINGKAGKVNEKQMQYLETIHKEMTRLEKYIHSFLDIAKIESGQVELQIEAQDIGDVLQEIIQGFTVQAGKKAIELVFERPLSLPLVSIDTLQMTRVFSNLLDNAIKYSNGGKTIGVEVYADNEELIVAVTDQGPGIALEDQNHIFDSFSRLPGQDKEEGGSGLGLSAVKAIVEAHGGRAWVKSRPGQGSSFYISVPIA